MGDRWRLGLVERSVLEAMDELGARGPDRPHLKCSRFVKFLADERGITPRYSFDALCTLSQPWLLHIPLVDFHGNNGGPDDSPAPPQMTEARLSAAGQMVLAAERGMGPLVPIALINGDLHADGTAPPFSPTRVVDALLALLDSPDLSDDEILENLGPPVSPSGCNVACDFAALAAGESTTLVWTAHLSREVVDQRAVLVLSHLPLGIGPDTVIGIIRARVEAMNSDDPDWYPAHVGDWQLLRHASQEATAIPLVDIRDESWGAVADNNTRIVCEPLADADLADCERQITATWGVRIERDVQLAAPLPQLMRDLVDPDSMAQRAALAQLAVGVLDGPDRPKGEMRATTGSFRATAFVLPDTYNEDHRYGTPEDAALAEPRRLDEEPRLVSVEISNESDAEVEVDKGRHPADRVLYRCVRDADGWRR